MARLGRRNRGADAGNCIGIRKSEDLQNNGCDFENTPQFVAKSGSRCCRFLLSNRFFTRIKTRSLLKIGKHQLTQEVLHFLHQAPIPRSGNVAAVVAADFFQDVFCPICCLRFCQHLCPALILQMYIEAHSTDQKGVPVQFLQRSGKGGVLIWHPCKAVGR